MYKTQQCVAFSCLPPSVLYVSQDAPCFLSVALQNVRIFLSFLHVLLEDGGFVMLQLRLAWHSQ